MSEETEVKREQNLDQEQAPADAGAAAKDEAQVDPVPTEKVRKSRAVERKPSMPSSKMYITTEKHSIPFDIQIKGEVLQGAWSRSTGLVEFEVPGHLVEGFEMHHHFVAGNVKAAE